MSLDVVIVGGGPHGVHIAARLVGEGVCAPSRMRIVDPGDRLLALWLERTATTGMCFLRSPAVHHLDLHPWSLQRFAGARSRRGPGLFTAPYDRPATSLFNAHCEQVIASYGLDALHLQDHVEAVHAADGAVRLMLRGGDELVTRDVVLALGSGHAFSWPAWAPRGCQRVRHVFAPNFDGWPTQAGEQVAIVGGGITAAQVAIRLGAEGHRVALLSRHPVREHQFDSEPGWLGPKNMAAYETIRDPEERRREIRQARHRGSMPSDVHRSLREACAAGAVVVHSEPVESLLEEPEGRLTLGLSGGRELAVERVLLATGVTSERPGGALVDGLIERSALPVAPCGYPLVNSDLRWGSGVYVAGALAELELGPVARNIAGARRAAERIAGALARSKMATLKSAS